MTYLIIIYSLICLILLFVFFPSSKETLLEGLRLFWFESQRIMRFKWYQLTRPPHVLKKVSNSSLSQQLQSLNQRQYKSARHYVIMTVITVCLIIFPPLMVFIFTSKNILDEYDDTQVYKSNEQILALLTGEKLVPPPPLPPEVFMTQEVLLIRPALVDASRDWVLLDDDFSQRLLLVFKIMKERHGYDMAILEGYRSASRQNSLAKMGSSVTNAKAYQSYHQFGLAADCAFKRDGKLVITEKDPWAMRGYRLYGEVAKSAGLNWGGDWKMMDFGHVEFRKPNTISHR